MLDQLKHKRKMNNNFKLQHHSKGQRSLVLQKSRPWRFRGIPRRFREMLLEANLREISGGSGVWKLSTSRH
jgi:hypothetical protein